MVFAVGAPQMVELDCPKCGRGGSIPKKQINTRFVCKKCNAVFYMNPSGRTILGEPPRDPSAPAPTRPGREELPMEGLDLDRIRESINKLKLVPTLAVLFVLGLGYLAIAYAFGPPESLADRSMYAAMAVAEGDTNKLA